jgi:hypothetical protein
MNVLGWACGGMVDAADLKKIECSRGNARCRTAQIRGNLMRLDAWQSRAKPFGNKRKV